MKLQNSFYLFLNEGMGDIFVSLSDFLYLKRKQYPDLQLVRMYTTSTFTGGFSLEDAREFNTLYKLLDFFHIQSRVNDLDLDLKILDEENYREYKEYININQRVPEDTPDRIFYPRLTKKSTSGDYVAMNFYSYVFAEKEHLIKEDPLFFHKFLEHNDLKTYLNYIKNKNIKVKWLYQYAEDIRNNDTFNQPISYDGKDVMERNIDVIKDSKIFISSEGFWTHIAQSLRKHTIGFSVSKNVRQEFNRSRYVTPASDINELIKCTEQVI